MRLELLRRTWGNGMSEYWHTSPSTRLGRLKLKNMQWEGEFVSELEERMREYFTVQKRFSTIVSRSLALGLIDFPIIILAFPFIMGSLFFHFLMVLSPSSDRCKQYANWFRNRRSRCGWFARLLPPYRTKSAQSKLSAFKRMVIVPLRQKYPPQVRALDFNKVEEILIETLTAWEKIPNLMECILTPCCWLLGISFLGLDPKTVIVLSRNKEIYHRWEQLGRNWFGKIYLRMEWLFHDTIPWTFSAKFIAVGLIAYIVLMVIIEFISVQILYREGVEKRLLENIALAYHESIDRQEAVHRQ